MIFKYKDAFINSITTLPFMFFIIVMSIKSDISIRAKIIIIAISLSIVYYFLSFMRDLIRQLEDRITKLEKNDWNIKVPKKGVER